MSEDLTVSVAVNAALWEYLTGIHDGSDIVSPDWKSPLWVLVKSRLQTVPKDYKPELPGTRKGWIRIALPHPGSHLEELYSEKSGAVVRTDTLFRNWLDEKAQRQVENLLMKEFKACFRNYMTGAVSCNPDLEIKDAIDRFCEVHNLEMDAITYEMLRKDWYRYRNREARGEPAAVVKENF